MKRERGFSGVSGMVERGEEAGSEIGGSKAKVVNKVLLSGIKVLVVAINC